MIKDINLEKTSRLKNIERYTNRMNYDELSKHINFPECESCYTNGWIKIGGKYYYFKSTYPINELLMKELYNSYGVECVDYRLVKIGKYYAVMSKNFRTFDKDYNRLDDFLDNIDQNQELETDLTSVTKFVKKNTNRRTSNNLIPTINIMTSLDFFTGQADRYGRNMIVETNSNGITKFSPLTDNGLCFSDIRMNTSSGYIKGMYFCPPTKTPNSILTVIEEDKHKNLVKTLYALNNNPLFKTTLESTLDIDFNDIIRRVEEQYRIKISIDSICTLLSYLDIKKDIIEQTLKHTK